MNYFKSYYNRCAYSKDWYGSYHNAPPATILLYNDIDLYCIGYMEDSLPEGVIPLSENDALYIINSFNQYNIIPDVTYITEEDDTQITTYRLPKKINAIETKEIWVGDKLQWRWEDDIIEEPIIIKKNTEEFQNNTNYNENTDNIEYTEYEEI